MMKFFVHPKRHVALLVAILSWVIAALAVSVTFFSADSSQGLLRDFDNLFERCRLSIETNSEFDHEGLEETEVLARDETWDRSDKQQAWIRAGSELYTVLTEWTSANGTTRHVCRVKFADASRVLDEVEQALLLRRFLIIQTKLIGKGTHDVDRKLSPIPPTVNAAFLLSTKNPNGCRVTNVINFNPDGTHFDATTGEQTVHPCRPE
ncbi:hypothetical protein HJ526_04640 [Donghicola sp. C2-DW-16]|uniref:Uncharacterized protein n=1 Tax=Donghicola mangrovi TaxID=2729614 RepID=A0ABX2PB54_9RHOB|nr:hypothetical protein [Donghicola mangrovi]NVO26698.1 hypothetical protein [Donghicola mangrovi]